MVTETKVLAIASHVAYGYVGNTMVTFVLQAMGCDVAAINTVQFSNHTGYRQFKGRRTPASEIRELYTGLQQSYLTDFSVLLSGYSPSAEVVQTIGTIARDLRYRSTTNPGRFFWVLDPVMGDQGRLYVAEDIVPEYRKLIREADLILPNQYEAELLSGVTIQSLEDVGKAMRTLHKEHGIRHVVVTSVRVKEGFLTVVGSTSKTEGDARLFKVDIPVLDCFFSGTGDMFAALIVLRLREQCEKDGLLDTKGWVSEDDVSASELPLAIATCKVLSSMQMILEKTMKARDEEMANFGANKDASVGGVDGEGNNDSNGEEKRRYLAQTKAAEVRIVQNWKDLVEPEDRFKAEAVDV